MRTNQFFTKLILIFFILILTVIYAEYEKKKFYSYGDKSSSELILKKLANFNTIEVGSRKIINSSNFLKGSNGLFVHIWGTWCAPCEKEMPEFLKYASSLELKGVKFLLIAVNDDEIKIKKFMGRFSIPKNVAIVIDQQNKVMDLFGTLKVPESFLFDASGKHVNKFIGPQEWGQESYQTRLDFWLNLQNLVERKIETH
jgi:thiol-disulfide isomerase/thioredoxin